MSTPEELTLAVQAAMDKFSPLDHKPTGADVRDMEEAMAPPLFSCEEFDAANESNNLYGVIASDSGYLDLYTVAFAIPAVMGAKAILPGDAKLGVIKDLESEFRAKKADRALYKAADRACVEFIRHAVPETWIKSMKHRVLGYTAVTAAALMTHLRTTAGGMHEVDAILIPSQMMSVWGATESIPEYINELEELQQASEQANLPVTDASLVAIANKSMIAHGVFATTTSDFNKLPDAGRTWAAWKPLYIAAHDEEERAKRVTNPDGNPFGGAAARNIQQNNVPSDQMMDTLAGYLANLTASTNDGGDTMQQLVETNAALQAEAAAATSGGSTISQIVANNTTLTATNAMQAKELVGARLKIAALEKKSREAYANRRNGGDNDDSGATIAFRIVKRSGQGPPASWKIGGYCHTHGFGCNHASANCRTGENNNKHKKEATRSNTLGGCQDNKGWDSHLVGMPS